MQSETPHGSHHFLFQSTHLFFSRCSVVFYHFVRLYSVSVFLTEAMDKQKENFERLVRSHKDTIYTVCYMFSKDEDEVADLFQETLINVWRGLPKYQGDDEALRGWIYRVALNTCISLDRSKRRRKTVPLTMDVNFFDPQEERAQRVDQLHRRIARLQPFDRAIVLLWLEDLSYDEIGQILGITAKNVSVRLVRIREQMKKMKE